MRDGAEIAAIEPVERAPRAAFDEEHERAPVKPLYGAVPVRFVSIPTLIRMKEAAGRTQDRIDIEYLRMRLQDDAQE